jgi:hypothetical protein
MPLVRYFLFTSGMLLGLLFLSDWYFPRPVAAAASTDIDRSVIRIHSSRRWPAAIRIDTSIAMPNVPLPAMIAGETPVAVPAASVRQAYAHAFAKGGREAAATRKIRLETFNT